VSKTNALEISDEEFLSNPLLFNDEEFTEELPDKEEEEEEESGSDEVEDTLLEVDAEDTDLNADRDDLAEEEDAVDSGEEEEQEPDSSPDETEIQDESDDDRQESEETEEESEKDAKDDSTDFESFYKEITAPFKANSKMMQISNAEDAIKLMQMGANYSRKMGILKPQLKVMRMLQDHGLVDEKKLSFLIDLNKGDPTAINQLLKDTKIDPMEINLEESKEYHRPDYSVSDSAVELDRVVEDLKGSEHFQATLDVVTEKWDGKSKQIVASQPELLNIINDHMASGIYEIVSNEVERQRMFGRLNGLSDLDAYKQVGDSLDAEGRFDKEETPQNVTSKPRSKSTDLEADNTKIREKRRANGSTKRTAKTKSTENLNPLNISDEDFLKQFDPRFN